MRIRLFSSLLLLTLLVNLISPVVVLAKKDKGNEEVTTNQNSNNKKLDSTIIPTPSILQPKSKNINVIVSYQSDMLINDGAEFANNPNLKATVTSYSKQPGSENAAFIYEYVQFTSSPEVNILNDTAEWSDWQLLPDPWNTSNVTFTLKDTSVGVKKIFMRYKAIKKLYDTLDPYGVDANRYGRIDKITDIYYVDEIFFDNVPPTGSLTINNGAVSTTSRTGSLQISATDTVNGVEGSGLNGMRIANNCNVSNIDSNTWSEWEEVSNKENFNLGSGNIMTVCVQVRDKAGNITTLSDDILFKVIYSGGSSGSYHDIFTPGNNTFVDANGNRFVDRLAGTADYPFGLKSAYDLETPVINITSRLTSFGRVTQITDAQLPPPEITYIDVSDDQKSVKIYGVAMQKYDQAIFIVDYDYLKEGCTVTFWDNCIESTVNTVEGSLEHVGLSLYEKTFWTMFGIENEINWTWNDNYNGEWVIEMNLDDPNQHNLNLGDLVYARSKAWGTLDTGIEEIGEINFLTTDKLTSGMSNIEEVKDTEKVNLIKYIQDTYGIKLTERDSEWSTGYLVKLVEALEIVPEWMYKEYLTEIIRDDVSDTNPKAGGYTDYAKAGTVMEIYNGNTLQSLEYVYIHELMHVYQFRYGGQRNDSHTNPDMASKIYEYYNKFGFNDADGNGDYEYTWGTEEENWDDFVSAYAVSGAESNKPYEEFADTLAYYLIDQEAFYEFDNDRDKLIRVYEVSIKDGDPKNSEVIKQKFEYLKNIIFN